MDIEIPALHCPFPSRISPHAEALEAANLAWLDLLKLPRAERGRFGRLAARAYPDASLDMLAIAAAWATWLFLRDDQCDEGGIASDPRAMRVLAEDQIDVLVGKRPSRADPLIDALADLRERMLLHGGGRWMSRFLVNVQDYFDASVWEAENRAHGRIPDLETYIRLRDLTGAVKTCFDIFELVEGPLAVELRTDARLVRLMRLANRAICWSNDLFSVRKELAHGDVHNLVIVLRHAEGRSLGEAITRAAEMHDEVVRAFQEHALGAPPAMRRIIEALGGWVRANVDWSIETGRYGEPGTRPQASLPLRSRRSGAGT